MIEDAFDGYLYGPSYVSFDINGFQSPDDDVDQEFTITSYYRDVSGELKGIEIFTGMTIAAVEVESFSIQSFTAYSMIAILTFSLSIMLM